jgi:tRNA-uridine 2-sulfurtransferase
MTETTIKPFAVCMVSGGLDSTLAVKILLEAGMKVAAITFSSVFYGESYRWRGKKGEADKPQVDELFGIDLKTMEMGEDYYRMVADPPHGFGSNANPCVDCHTYMVVKTWEYAQSIGASFIATGEVLGQRPMSQRRDTLDIVERDAGVRGYLVRPLSAKLLRPTLPVTEGVLDLEKLYGIAGRGRKSQMELARKWGIDSYPTPGGGCLLTDPGYSQRLFDLREHQPDHERADMKLLQIGRHLRLDETTKFVVSRNQGENEIFQEQTSGRLAVLYPANFGGPSTAICGPITEENIALAAGMVSRYGKGRRTENAIVVLELPDGKRRTIESPQIPDESRLEQMTIKEK